MKIAVGSALQESNSWTYIASLPGRRMSFELVAVGPGHLLAIGGFATGDAYGHVVYYSSTENAKRPFYHIYKTYVKYIN